MSEHPLTRSTSPETTSRIGGAAQGGSAKPAQEREKLDRERGLEDDAQGTAEDGRRPGNVGGNSNDSRTDEQRSADGGGRI